MGKGGGKTWYAGYGFQSDARGQGVVLGHFQSLTEHKFRDEKVQHVMEV